jgi:hypothetical protein
VLRRGTPVSADGVDHTRLGYEVLVKRKVDALLDREDRRRDVSADATPAAPVIPTS